MRRREFLRTGAATLGAVALAGVAADAAAHPGPYRPLGRIALDGAAEVVVSADGETAYVAVQDGYATVDVSAPDRPAVMAERRDPLADRETGPLRNVQDVSVEGERLAVVGPANPRRDALSGLLVADVSDPAAPVEGAFFETDYSIHNCTLRDGFAYLTGNGAGSAALDAGDGKDAPAVPANPLVVVDVRDGDPVEVGRWSLLDADERWADVAAPLRPLHDVWVHDGVAYCAHWDAGTWLVDVSDPADPTTLGSVDAPEPASLADRAGDAARRESRVPPGNHHSTATDDSGDLLAVGRESWAVETDAGLVGGPSGIDLWDVRDPAAPRKLATVEPPRSRDPTFSGVWTTAHNFDLADGVLYAAWYQGGVSRHDVSDPAAPVRESWWRDPAVARFWTAQRAVPGSETGFFVASSTDIGGTDPALYTFPDHAGEQVNPPSLLAENATRDPWPVSPSPTRTPTRTASTAASATGGSPAGDGADDAAGDTGVAAPGLGIGSAVAALGAAGWWLRRARRR